VAISGEAGVGKSRLVDEVSRQAEQLNFALLRGTCFESDLSFPFAPVVDGLRAVFAGRNQGEIGRVAGALGPELIKLVPELRLILPGIRPSPFLEPAAEGR